MFLLKREFHIFSAIPDDLKHDIGIFPPPGHLISLLESLGTLSITASELKQLVSLLQLDEEEQQMPYCGRLMHAMSIMARRDGREGALHYFDINQQDAVSHDIIYIYNVMIAIMLLYTPV